MPDTPQLSSRDWDLIAEYLNAELQSRISVRKDLTAKWKDIDRQLRMEAEARNVESGQKKDWYPALEEPLQYNALEVILADLDDALFPKGAEWFQPLSNLSQKYVDRFNKRRQTRPLVGIRGPDEPDTRLDQEGADALVKAALDYFHRVYDFRANMNLSLAETIKYGCGVTRVRQVAFSRFAHEFRGVKEDTIVGPALAPTSILNTYPDPSPHFLMNEGVMTLPTVISANPQLLDDLKRAANKGGRQRGWRVGVVNRLKPQADTPNDRRPHVLRIEAEGDIIVPRSSGDNIFLPNVNVTVAVGAQAKVIRLTTNPTPWRSYVFMHYMKDDIRSPYGGSPLLKAHTVQKQAAFSLNDLLAVSRLNALPPMSYDSSDSNFQAQGGPEIYPGAIWETDAPDSIRDYKIGDPSAALQIYLALLQKYEDLTATNDPRRGAGVKSHTGSIANQLAVQRGVARTANLADDIAEGPLTTILNMEYDIIKKSMSRETPVPVANNGIEGWVNLHKDDLPDDVMFKVLGAVGVADEQQRAQNFLTWAQFTLQLAQLAAQLGKPLDLDFMALIDEGAQKVRIDNASRFVRPQQAAPQQPPGAPGLGAAANGAEGDPESALAALETAGGQLPI